MNWPHGRTVETIAFLVIILPKDTKTLQEDLNELDTWKDRWHYCQSVIILPEDTETLQVDLNELATWEDR